METTGVVLELGFVLEVTEKSLYDVAAHGVCRAVGHMSMHEFCG